MTYTNILRNAKKYPSHKTAQEVAERVATYAPDHHGHVGMTAGGHFFVEICRDSDGLKCYGYLMELDVHTGEFFNIDCYSGEVAAVKKFYKLDKDTTSALYDKAIAEKLDIGKTRLIGQDHFTKEEGVAFIQEYLA